MEGFRAWTLSIVSCDGGRRICAGEYVFNLCAEIFDGSCVYDVTASPKMGTADKLASRTPNPKPAVSGGKLPQTGQLWWPVPVMAIVGMLFVMFGWYRRRRFGEK
ncbi:MAG: LPXTG cell wall anchor domain-containing protein [Frisingicoccus sp.]